MTDDELLPMQDACKRGLHKKWAEGCFECRRITGLRYYWNKALKQFWIERRLVA